MPIVSAAVASLAIVDNVRSSMQNWVEPNLRRSGRIVLGIHPKNKLNGSMEIQLHGEGFNIGNRTVRWTDVVGIATYKHDNWSYDEICLAFRLADGSWIEASEKAGGFQSLAADMERAFPAVPDDWHRSVMLPAFATNYRVLWGSDGE